MKYLFFVAFTLFLGLGFKAMGAEKLLDITSECVYIFPSGKFSIDVELENNLSFLGFSCLEDDPSDARVILTAGKPEPVFVTDKNKFYIILPIFITITNGTSIKEGGWSGESKQHDRFSFGFPTLVDKGLIAEAIQNGVGNFLITIKLMNDP